MKQHLDSTAALGCYGICVYCTAAGDDHRVEKQIQSEGLRQKRPLLAPSWEKKQDCSQTSLIQELNTRQQVKGKTKKKCLFSFNQPSPYLTHRSI